MEIVLKNIVIVGGIGSLLFTSLLMILSFSGMASEIWDENGNFKKNINLKTIIGGLLFVTFLVGVLYVGNMRLIDVSEELPTFQLLVLNSFCIFFFIHIFDLLIIDYLIIVKWHPDFLNLPKTTYYRSFKPHVKGFFRGIPFGIGSSLIVSLISLYIQ